MSSKKGAIELSMSTIVIVVIAMALLIGGIMLVQNILEGANEIVDLTDENVLQEINELFSEGKDIVVKLGSSKIAEVRADGEMAGIVFAANTVDGDGDTSDMRYTLSLDDTSKDNCLEELGEEETLSFFNKYFDQELEFDEAQNSGIAASQIIVIVPEGTILCNQLIKIDVYDGDAFVGRESFTVDIVKASLF
jgi:hypothetical protein